MDTRWPLSRIFLVVGYTSILTLGSISATSGEVNLLGSFSSKDKSPLNRVTRQLDTADGFSLMALGVFSAFVKYMAYHFIMKNAEEGGERSLQDNLLDLTAITHCLTEESETLTSNFHLHCFFPSLFSREDNTIISMVIQGSSSSSKVDQQRSTSVPQTNYLVSSMLDKSWLTLQYEQEAENRNHRVRRTKPAGTIISMLSLAAFGAFFFYFAYFNINKYMGGGSERSLSSGPVQDYLWELNSIISCLQEEEFTPRLRCFIK